MRLGGDPYAAIRYAKWASGRLQLFDYGGETTLRVCPENIDDVIRVMEAGITVMESRRFFHSVPAEKRRLEELRKIKKMFGGLSKAEKELINFTTSIPVVVCGAGEVVPLPKTPGGIGGGEIGVKELDIKIVATDADHIDYITKLLREAKREDIRVIDIDLIKSKDHLGVLADILADVVGEKDGSIYSETREIEMAI